MYGGEAESVALYKQEKAELLMTDDDNVRKKKDILNIKVIGSLGILLKLRKENVIDRNKFSSALEQFRKIGWFSSSILDKVHMEGEKYE